MKNEYLTSIFSLPVAGHHCNLLTWRRTWTLTLSSARTSNPVTMLTQEVLGDAASSATESSATAELRSFVTTVSTMGLSILNSVMGALYPSQRATSRDTNPKTYTIAGYVVSTSLAFSSWAPICTRSTASNLVTPVTSMLI